MTIELRALDPAEWDEWYGTLVVAFGGIPDAPEEVELWRELIDPGRSIAGWDGARCVAATSTFAFRLSVPGGAVVPAAGVTGVGVLGTHRRRGILTSMMRRQLDGLREQGMPLAVLTASEPAIYGRFGYGIATMALSAEIDTARVRLDVPPGTDDVRLRYVTVKDSLAACEELYARLVPHRPGMLARQPGWDRFVTADPESYRDGASPLQCVLAERDGELVGYARYRVSMKSGATGVDGSVSLSDLDAVDPAASAALWRYLFGIDLTQVVKVQDRPVDDPVQHLVSDVRRCGMRLQDRLHLRLVEVGAALEARTYAAPVDVVFEVEDAFCPWNAGRWRLTGDAKGASCVRTEDPAELALSVRELGAAYLGGVTLASLAGAGRVRELRAGALAEASTAFGSDSAPWLPHGF
ncbi:GNAT family N-acetyltransferase [Streptomyces sp. NBC_00083]|uniref:GNAT family N-acetyltransferase n=1 Tax=Streptomyces sp. NBC_00083 TaxID=2975647 RepID=UPI0022518E96|nr:GNAT family N-acetyltransferase [Streptomyces sp. NBC_00083]MCX5382429.1 GNAT family N-acetyltransferase [Streptomyces sp. NBC_00083]